MRVMVMTAPGSGLYLPTIPLAWAWRAAGHDVLVAGTGAASEVIARSGFATVDACPGRDVQAEFLAAGRAINATPADQPRPRGGMGLFGELMAEGLLAQAEAFAPDVVVATLEQGAAPLIAATLDVPLIEQSVRLAWAGADETARRYRASVAEFMEPTRERLGLRPGTDARVVLDVRPASVGGRADGRHRPLRYVPYNEGRVLPALFAEPVGPRPRVCVTMGSVLPTASADPQAAAAAAQGMRGLLTAVAGADVDVVVAMGADEAALLTDLPANVRLLGWTPLSALLPTCSLVVHHGGAGTSFACLTAGVPQLVLPRGADQPANAAVLAAAGVAVAESAWTADPGWVRDRVGELLHDDARRAAAGAVRAEIAAMPSPAQVVAELVAELAAELVAEPHHTSGADPSHDPAVAARV